MAELTSKEQNARIFTEMRDGAILSEIQGHPLSEVIGAIRSLNDDERGRLIDDWLIAVVSRYSGLAQTMPSQISTHKLIMENCSKLAKSFGEESSSKRKTGGRNIYIRAVRTKASIAASETATGPTALGAKVVGGHVPTLMDKINEEVKRQLGPLARPGVQVEPFIEVDAEDAESERPPDQGRDNDTNQTTVTVSVVATSTADHFKSEASVSGLHAFDTGLPVMAQRLLQPAYIDPLADIPPEVAGVFVDDLLAVAPQLEEFWLPTSEIEHVPYLAENGRTFWTSTKKSYATATTPHADSVNIPAAGTGVRHHKGVAVDTSELKAIKASREAGPPVAEVPDTFVAPLVSKKPLPKAFSKPLPKEKIIKTPKPIEPPLTAVEKAERRLEKRKIALALYKQNRGE